ncbi:hypothetical protein K2173_026002 [Erythroxylum novogranatense]|uniref:Peptidase A1 domain-containing protein n=1 Tax=Erythroxylum novogranatense TaxID=1862640 RepID=A0AAV8SHT0_9ROSI|nr:hypothetical protein K2173_026002 [Erythroxylum novogranatense]
MSTPHILILLLLLIYVNAFCFQVHAFNSHDYGDDNGSCGPDDTITFELIHRHAPELADSGFPTLGPPKSRLDRMKQLMHSDHYRQQTIGHRLGQRRKAFEINGTIPAEMPIRSAADSGIGQYFVSFRVGSPRPRKFVLIADTGSDLTWIHCEYRCEHCLKLQPYPGIIRIFDADTSPSFRTIPCSSITCKDELSSSFSLTDCPAPEAPCLYDYRYADGRNVIGLFANETVTVGLHNHRKIKLHDVLIGCSQVFNGSFRHTDGVMGLGYSQHSFAVRIAKLFGYKFSYCLVDHFSPSNLRNFLTFGDVKTTQTLKMQYTELVVDVINPYYAVNVSGISVGNTRLKIPSPVWNVYGNGGAIIDSGSSLTYLTEPAYNAVMEAYEQPLANYTKVKIPDLGPMELCFEAKWFNETSVPKLTIHFMDGANFEPPLKSYFIDAAEGVLCLGIVSTAWPGVSVIGNIMQQNYMWEFDLGAAKLGFAPSSCIFDE